MVSKTSSDGSAKVVTLSDLAMFTPKAIPSKSNKGDILKLKSSSSSAPYRIFNLGNNKPVTLESFINAIEASTGKKAIKEYLPMQPGDVQKTFANIDKAGESLGFIPSTSIEEGIKKFVNWYIEYYER